MNQIEQILTNSVYESSQFNAEQINTLNEMINLGIKVEQIGIIAHPKVSELSYSILADYLKDHSITQNEYSNYISIDDTRINDIIINVYLGKMHGLTNEQIDLYANKNCKNIKISRIIVEKCKDIPEDKLHKFLTHTCGSNSTEGKALIQEFINGNLTIDRLLSIYNYSSIKANIFNDIMTGDERLIHLYEESNLDKADIDQSYKNIHLIYKLTPDNRYIANLYKDLGGDEKYELLMNSKIRFDSANTFNTVLKRTDFLSSAHIKRIQDSILITASMVTDLDGYKSTFILENGYIDTHQYKKDLITIYYIIRVDERDENIHWYKEMSFEDFYKIIQKDGGKSYLERKLNNKNFDVKNYLKYIDYADNFENLIKLYTTKKDKELEIPYLEEHLKNANHDQIANIIKLKQNKISNETIHNYIEKYMDKIFSLPIHYYNYEIDKLCTYEEFVNVVDLFIKSNSGNSDVLARYYLNFKQQGATAEELQYFIDNQDKISRNINRRADNCNIRLEILKIYIEIGMNNKYSIDLSFNDAEYEKYLSNYNYAKTNFKNKLKCIEYYCTYLGRARNINENLLYNIEKWTDDEFYKVLKSDSSRFINYCLKMSDFSTNYKILSDLYDKIDVNSIDTFIENNEKVTTDIVVKFCKDNKIDKSIIAKLIPVSPEEFVQDTVVSSFNNSKNFKAIQYDEDNIFIDIINNKKLIGTHIFKFSKEDDNYNYIFEIKHETDILNYTSKINTKQDVIESINKSIALIDGIDEYQEYVTELQDMLNNF